MLSPCVIAGGGSRVTERLIGLIDQLGAGFSFAMQRGRMHEAIGVPDLHMFMPGASDFSLRRVRRKFQEGVVVGGAFLLHWFPCVSKCSGVRCETARLK